MKKATLALLVLAVLLQVGAAATPASGRAPAGNVYLEARKLLASDGAVSDQFGGSVGVSGDTAIVGALADDDAGSASGSTYIFERDLDGPDSWAEAAKLTALDAAANDQFGISVGISGDYAVVGAFADDDLRGAAYVFERNAGGPNNWGEVKKLVASDAQLNDRFGKAVAISGDTVIVGALLEDGGCPPANPNCASGSAYIFQRDEGGEGNWGEVQKILPNDPVAGQTFGNSVSISGDYAVIGAIGDSTLGAGAGAAYVFERGVVGANGWVQVKKLFASDGNYKDKFGRSLGISGSTVVVGAFSADVGANFVGAAYVFERDYPQDGNWGETKKLIASDASFNDQFGISAAIHQDAIIIGAFAADDACPYNVYCDSGKAYIYGRNTGGVGNWGEIHPVVASDTAEEEFFGISVAITNGAAVVGAHHKQNNPLVKMPGAAYVFTLPRPTLNFFKDDEPLPE